MSQVNALISRPLIRPIPCSHLVHLHKLYDNFADGVAANRKGCAANGFRYQEWPVVGVETNIDTVNQNIYAKVFKDADDDHITAALSETVTGDFDYSFNFTVLSHAGTGGDCSICLSEVAEDVIDCINNSRDQVGANLVRLNLIGLYVVVGGVYTSTGWWAAAVAGTWYHCHIIRVGNTAYIYIYDDEAHTAQLYTTNGAFASTATLTCFGVVGRHDNTAPANFTEARVDDVEVFG